jgi:hypothetical protein
MWVIKQLGQEKEGDNDAGFEPLCVWVVRVVDGRASGAR